MSTGWPVSFARACMVGFFLIVGLGSLPGCDDAYPQDLHYPARTDSLVVDKPTTDAKRFDRPGEFPKLFIGVEDGKSDLDRNSDRDEKLRKLLLDPLDGQKLNPALREQIAKSIDELYGTPAAPKIKPANDDAANALKQLSQVFKLDDATMAFGSRSYRDQCMHCHGLTGDGRGPTAPWVNPHPRDYRQGIFKFSSSSQDVGARKPLKEDLVRTIYEGIEGTSMPNFRLLPTEELEAVVSYLVHLSLRGQNEFEVLKDAGAGNIEGPSAVASRVADFQQLLLMNWAEAQNSRITPDPTAMATDEQRKASVLNGYKIFLSQGEAGCISCHTDFGRQSAYKYDAWGTVVKPANLTSGVFRGGHRPIDIYARIHSGINGSGMQAFGKKKPTDTNGLDSKTIWDLVNFVQVMPFPAMREKFGIKLEAN